MPNKINQAGRWERFCHTLYQRVDLWREARRARASCRLQLRALRGGLAGSRRAYREQVLPFWRRYGLRPAKMWYDLYGYKDGAYDPRYIPEDLYWQHVYPALNQPRFRHAYTDKCFYERLFPTLKQPRTILKNSNHCFYGGAGETISRAQARLLLAAQERFVIKPAIYSGEGVDIFFYDRASESASDPAPDLDRLLARYGSDFIVQEISRQHPVLAAIHPHSLNTIRVISFLFQGTVQISSAILRMGVGGTRLDNVAAGGMACPIGDDGRLAPRAMTYGADWVTAHPGGTVFDQITIPSYERVLAEIRNAHRQLPHFGVIGWDFAIDEAGDPLFIEYNGAPGLNQVSCGPLFGDRTGAVLDTILRPEPELSPGRQAAVTHIERMSK